MKKVSLIIPIYNEENHLQDFLKKIDTLDLKIAKELVIIDDCSQDLSAEIIRNFNFASEYQFIQQDSNSGKGAAVRCGIEKATGDIIGIQDADFEYDPMDIPKILDSIIDSNFDVVYGSRFTPGRTQVYRTFHYLVNRILTLLSNFFSGLYLTDMETCYKFFRAEIVKNIHLESNRFGFEPEITAKLARLKIKIAEVPISYFPRSYMDGKKITWKDGVSAIWQILYYNLRSSKRNYNQKMPLQYLSKKYQWL